MKFSFAALVAGLVPVCIFGRFPENGSLGWYQRKLYTDLLQDYMQTVRPAVNTTYSLPIKITSFLFWSVNDLEEQQQIMSSVVFLRLVWEDFRLSWNPKDYGMIQDIEVPVQQLWYPDIYVDNAKDTGNPVTTHMLAIVKNDGTVRWEQIMNLRTYCHVDLSHFPYDQHNCSVFFSLWAYDMQKAHLTMNKEDKENATSCTYITAHDWEVTDCGSEQMEYQHVTGDEENLVFPIVGYWLMLKRDSGFTSHLFVAPSVALCLITPVIFLLPPASKEKIIFGTGILLSNIILLGELIKFIPTAYPAVPLIGKYILSNIILTSMALLVSGLIINMWSRRTTRVKGPPQILVTIFLGPVAKLLFLTSDQFCESLEDEATEQKEQVVMSNTLNAENLQLSVDGTNSSRLRQAQIYARKIAKLQWHQLGAVIDRIFLILYLLILTGLTFSFAQYM